MSDEKGNWVDVKGFERKVINFAVVPALFEALMNQKSTDMPGTFQMTLSTDYIKHMPKTGERVAFHSAEEPPRIQNAIYLGFGLIIGGNMASFLFQKVEKEEPKFPGVITEYVRGN